MGPYCLQIPSPKQTGSSQPSSIFISVPWAALGAVHSQAKQLCLHCRASGLASLLLLCSMNSTAAYLTIGTVWLHPVHVHYNVVNKAMIAVRNGGVGEEEKGSCSKCREDTGGVPCSCTLAVLEAVEIALGLRELSSPCQKTQRMPPTAPGTTSSSVGMGTASPTSGSVMERTTAGTGRMRRSVKVSVPDAAPGLHPSVLHQLWGLQNPSQMGCVHVLPV